MGIFDIFRSPSEIERRKRHAQRHHERSVERVIARIARRIKMQEKERASLWAKAKDCLVAGKKADARRLLERYKALDVMIIRLERQRTLWQARLNAFSSAGDASEATEALAQFGKLLDVDPEKIVDALEKIDDVSGEIGDIDAVLDREYKRDADNVAKIASAIGDANVDDDLMTALENEAAADIVGGPPARVNPETRRDGTNAPADESSR